VWFFVGNEVSDGPREALGINYLIGAVDKNTKSITTIGKQVRDLQPEVSIVEFDVVRSQIRSPCFVGELCEFQLRVKRTEFGVVCDAPTYQAYIIDSNGLTHNVEIQDANAQRIPDSWSITGGSFIIPDLTSLGITEFFLDLAYSGCIEDNPNAIFRQQSTHLVFRVE